MNFYRRHWYEIGIVIFIALSFLMGFFGQDVDPLRRILIFSYMALLIHQFEEYAIPGGFPIAFNYGFMGNHEDYDRHFLSSQMCLWINVFAAYPFYIIAIIFPHVIWLGLAQIFFGMIFQFLAHGFIMNIKNRTFYNPGMGAAVLLHFPIGIYYIHYILVNGLVSGNIVFLWGFLGMLGGIVLTLPLPGILWKKFGKVIPFEKEEVEKFHIVQRLDNAAARKGGKQEQV